MQTNSVVSLHSTETIDKRKSSLCHEGRSVPGTCLTWFIPKHTRNSHNSVTEYYKPNRKEQRPRMDVFPKKTYGRPGRCLTNCSASLTGRDRLTPARRPGDGQSQ